MLIELGEPGEELDDSLLPALYRLFLELDTDVRAHTVLRVCGRCADAGVRLRRFAVRHGVAGLPAQQEGNPAGRGNFPAAHRPALAPGTAGPAVAAAGHRGLPGGAVAPAPEAGGPAVAAAGAGPVPPVRGGSGAASSEPDPVPPLPPLPTATRERTEAAPHRKEGLPAASPGSRPAVSPVGQPVGSSGSRPTAAMVVPKHPGGSAPPTAGETPRPARPAEAERTPGCAEPGRSTALPERTGGLPEPERSAADPLAVPGAAPLPFTTTHRSTDSERQAFRDLVGGQWQVHYRAVVRALSRLPALRGPDPEALRADLAAVRVYLTAVEGAFRHTELESSLRLGDGRLLPYAVCLTSGLRHLPAYRGGWRCAGARRRSPCRSPAGPSGSPGR